MMASVTALSLAFPAEASNDELFSRQWSLTQIEVARAWTVSKGAGITIGIVDTGVDAGHPDLAGKVLSTADCTSGTCRDGAGQDTNGHGTIVSGIAAAASDNGRGMAGVAPDANLVVAKVLDGSVEGSPVQIEAGIHWVVDHGAKVVNLSLGDENFLSTSIAGSPLKPAIEWAWSRGAVPVLASGNYNSGLLDLGSQNYGNIDALVVGATDRGGHPAAYSSPIGTAKWGLVAPGGVGRSADGPDANVISTYLGGEYVSAAGTSMAVPHVSGVVALLLARGMSPSAAVQTLLSGLDRISCGSGCQGRLNAAAALGAGPVPVTTVTAPPPGTVAGDPTTVAPRRDASRRPVTTTTTAPTTTVPPTTAVTYPAPVTDPVPPVAAGRVMVLGATGEGGGRSPMTPITAGVLLFGVSLGLGAVTVRSRLTGGAGP